MFRPNKIIHILLFSTIYMAMYFYSLNAFSSEYPMSKEDKERERIGTIFGNWIKIPLGSSKKEGNVEASKNTGQLSHKNDDKQYMWQAALEALSFVPLNSTDSLGGVIVSDWYIRPEDPTEKFKFVIEFKSGDISPKNLDIKVHKYVLQDDNWVAGEAPKDMAKKMEVKILIKAKQLKSAAK